MPGGDGQYTFNGAEGYPAQPVAWTKTTDGRLYSGTGNNLDRAIARKISVPAGNPRVTVDLEYQTEAGWDFAFVQVYDPTAKKWVSLERRQHDEQRRPAGELRWWRTCPASPAAPVVYDAVVRLAKYAGQDVFVAVRYISDGVGGRARCLAELARRRRAAPCRRDRRCRGGRR